MNPVEWLCSVVDTLNSKQSRPRFQVVATRPNSVTIKNLETHELWTFDASVAYTPDQISCCAHSAVHPALHSTTCTAIARQRVFDTAPEVLGTIALAYAEQERRQMGREMCGKGGCSLPVPHNGSHRGSCGCLSGCAAHECPNV